MTFNPYPEALKNCQLCPRLLEHREAVGRGERMRRLAYAKDSYWAKPVPGFGDPKAQILLLGLAPGAHGSNRTGRMFTGDASGDFLYPALYRAGLASQPESTSLNDGLSLNHLWISAACRCVPPGNKPLTDELKNCQTWLRYDFTGLKNIRLVLALGAVAHNSYLEYLKAQGHKITKAEHPFGHGHLHQIGNAYPLLDSYHVSFQNTNTGKLTESMFEGILEKAKSLALEP